MLLNYRRSLALNSLSHAFSISAFNKSSPNPKFEPPYSLLYSLQRFVTITSSLGEITKKKKNACKNIHSPNLREIFFGGNELFFTIIFWAPIQLKWLHGCKQNWISALWTWRFVISQLAPSLVKKLTFLRTKTVQGVTPRKGKQKWLTTTPSIHQNVSQLNSHL